jgi:tetratricopeptide (TPR) repeat protein
MGRTIPHLVCAACLCLLAACTNRPPALLPSPPAVDFGSLIAADALVRQGCYACLTDALSIYERLAVNPAFPSAQLRAADTAILVALREREIGLGARDGRKRAGALAASLPVPYNLAPYLEMLDVVPWKPGSISKERQDEMVGVYRILTSNAPEWRRLLQRNGHGDLVRASLRLSLECSYRSSLTGRDTPDPWRPSSDAPPLVRFRSAMCQGHDTPALAAMLAADPRFAEIELFLGESAFGQGRLVEAERHMLPAFDAFPDLAVAASYLGSIYMAMEDFDEGLVYYQEAVAIIPGHREALLGQMKLLSYLGRSEDAVRVASQMIDLGTWYMGDAYYWRAWNRQRKSDWEGAWADLQEAKKYLPMDGAVAKLTGLIALGRGEPVRAHEEFRIAIRYNDKDSDAWFYLASVLSTLKRWTESAEAFAAAEPLYAKDEEALREKIKEIAASKLGDARKARLTTAKERQVAATRLQQARSAFSAAAGYFNIGDFAKAQPLAERAVAHPELAESARKLLERLPKGP